MGGEVAEEMGEDGGVGRGEGDGWSWRGVEGVWIWVLMV